MLWYARISPDVLLTSDSPYRVARFFFPVGARQEFLTRLQTAVDLRSWMRRFLLEEFCPQLAAGEIVLSAKDAYRMYFFTCDLLLGRGAVVSAGEVFAVRSVVDAVWRMRPCEVFAAYRIYPADSWAKDIALKCRAQLHRLPNRWRLVAEALKKAYPELFYST